MQILKCMISFRSYKKYIYLQMVDDDDTESQVLSSHAGSEFSDLNNAIIDEQSLV